MSNRILGISSYYHDSAACLLIDGQIVAAAQEERFTREKHDASFPINAVRYCLAEAGITDGKLDAVALYDKPILKFHRILETHLCTAPGGLRPFMKAIPGWLREKLWLPPQIYSSLEDCGITDIGDIYFPEHHESHAASAFFPSPFEDAAVLTIDGVGEWACATIGVGEGSSLKLIEEMDFPHSLGLLYSAFTYFTGFKVNSGEYKLMGLAPYGSPLYTDLILDKLMDLKEDGSFRLNMDYFGFLDDLVMVNEKFSALFNGPARQPESPITRRELDIARSIQAVTEEIVVRMARHARKITGKSNLCMAGGVALNCVANGRLLREKIFDGLWVQPAATDAGGAVGAALAVYHGEFDAPRNKRSGQHGDDMEGSLLGPVFSDRQIQEYLDAQGIAYTRLEDEAWAETLASLVADQKVIGLFQGRMEFGPRALGNRSIIADPRSTENQSVLNQKIKFRESFRPFAASVLEERMPEYFDIEGDSPYMLIVANVRDELCNPPAPGEDAVDIYERVNQVRSTLPAITHVDYSTRLQSVSRETNPRYYDLIKAFDTKTGCGMVINTSFNVRGEPIVCTPTDAYACFMRTNIDYLAMGSFLLDKKEQSKWTDSENWQEAFSLD
ncbi:MAG: carbamoyltransferase [Halioglobus sp.]|nr:carbamoyltransferase [Halioglobus sp.]